MANFTKVAPKVQEIKAEPSQKALQFLLNYSKSVEAKKIKKESLLIHLN
ncbi:MAG: hypothetical protein H3C31_12325 [Brumimicrobium sp.]|nr:hypothetical protein [Brumimicrobium sp.]